MSVKISDEVLREKERSAIALLGAINGNADESTLRTFEEKTDEIIKEMKRHEKERGIS